LTVALLWETLLALLLWSLGVCRDGRVGSGEGIPHLLRCPGEPWRLALADSLDSLKGVKPNNSSELLGEDLGDLERCPGGM